MKKPKLLLFDGNALVHRAFHALPPLTTRKTGEMVGAVYGFALILLRTIDELRPTHYAIAFDTKAPTFRHRISDQYKANRPPTPDELLNQLGRVRELVEALHIPIFELDNYEADDVLGTLGHQASEQGIDSIIVTGDADAMQLVSPRVKVLYPKPRGSFSDTVLYDEAAVIQKYDVRPKHIADLKALAGDPSDNICGVHGIGKVTASRLIRQFGSIEQIYTHIDNVTPAKLQTILRENEAVARQSKELATIVKQTPVTLNLDDCQASHYDRNRVTGLFRELEFFSLLNRLPETDGVKAETVIQVKQELPPNLEYHLITTTPALYELINRLSLTKSLSFDLETTSLDSMLAQLVGISLSVVPGKAYYIPVGHVGWEQVEQLPLNQVINQIKPILEDSAVSKIAHNGKYDVTVLAEHGVTVNNLSFDTMIAAYLLSEKSLSLNALAFSKLGIEMTPITNLIGSGAKKISMAQVSMNQVADYACADADMTLRLAKLLDAELREEGLWKLFDEVEMPLVPVLVHMERNGIALDIELLRKMSHRLGKQLLALEDNIYKEDVGHQFNINSPQQLSHVLFEELKLSPSRKVKSGFFSTEASVLEELRGAHPVVDHLLKYRHISKLKSTYIDALPSLVNPKTRRVHTSLNQTQVTTGRLSSSKPNLQNIAVRDDLGQEIRQAFIAPPGSYLLSADYSQIDLRALAHLSQDKGLLDAFINDADIHTATAARLFSVDTSQVTPDMRRVAKTVNFGVIYGMSEYGLEQATGLSRYEASQFIASYFEQYPGVKQYLESTKQQVREKGYVQTLLGRRRSIAEINSANRQVREAAERMAINMPVQGTSADIIKVAMNNLYSEMNKRQLKSRLLLQVHDELIFEVLGEELDEMRQLVPDLMSNALQLSIPLKVDTTTGNNWGDME